MYRRPDGLYEKILTIDSQRIAFRGKTEREAERKILDFHGVEERGPLSSWWRFNLKMSLKSLYKSVGPFLRSPYLLSQFAYAGIAFSDSR